MSLVKHFLLFVYVLLGMCRYVSAQATFDLVPSTYSGLDFKNTVVDTRAQNILKYANFYGGGGVGIADFNNDGLQDLYFTGNLAGDALYENKGNLVFENKTGSAGIVNDDTWSSGVSIADVNGDGLQDIYISKELYDYMPERRKNKLYINQGNMTFIDRAEEWGVANTERTRHAVFFDYNNDGLLDLYILNQPPNPGSYSDFFGQELLLDKYSSRLYKNIDHKRFEDVTEQSGLLKPGFPNSVVASDFNNDGWIDLYVSNDFNAPDFLYINNADGTFHYATEQSLKHTSFYSMGVDCADINNDGLLDVMVLDMVAEDNYRLKSNMSGMDVSSFWKVVAEGGHYQYMFNTLQLNNGNLNFSDVAQLANVAATDWSWSNLIADFDNDGYKDIYITNGLLRDIRNTDADKRVADYVMDFSKKYIREHPNLGNVDVWDILPLEKTLKLIPSVPLKNYMYKNSGYLRFKNVAEEWGLGQDSFSNGSAYADLDNDGDLEIVVNNVNQEAFLYKNNTVENRQGNYIRFELTTRNGSPVLGSKLAVYSNQTQQLQEITNVRGMYSTSEQIVHFGSKNNEPIDSLIITWPNKRQKILYNLPTDKQYKIYDDQGLDWFPKSNSSPIVFTDKTVQTKLRFKHKENYFNDYEKQVLLPHKLSQLGPAMCVGDIDQDGREDIFIGGASGQAASLFTQQIDGSFTELTDTPWKIHKFSEDIDATFFDADNDGDLDLYVVSGGNAFKEHTSPYLDRLYINQGNGKFSFKRQRLPEIYESGSVVKPCDFDSDGDLDLFVGTRMIPWKYPESPNSYLLENEDGYFKKHSKSTSLLKELGMVTDAVWIDYDGDKDQDLLVVGEWMPISTFENQNGHFKKVINSLSSYKGWWYSIEKGDLDKDGDPDLIVGNLGKNYKYKASPEEPFEVFYDDFDDNGQKDIVLTYYNYGIKYPLRGFSCSSQQVPSLKKKIKKYDIFANLNVNEVYGENLSNALHLEATHFESIFLKNQGHGAFEKKSLPLPAQYSSINDILIQDFNQDNFTDVLTIGNFLHAEIETPRNDAGIGLLLSGGSNGLHAINSAKSGFIAPGDAKKMRLLTIRNIPHVIVANNNDIIQIFKLNKRL